VPSGARALGIAESYRDPPAGSATTSTLAGVVVRADRAVDGAVFGSCTVGGTDATESIVELWECLDRPDVRQVFVAGIAPAWFNVVDLPALHRAIDRPVIGVGFEASDGLGDAIQREFDGADREERLAVYRRQPDRQAVTVGDGADGGEDGGGPDGDDETVYCRFVGIDAAEGRDVVRAHMPADSGRPEPVRVARLVARARDRWYREGPSE
jgi:endonuclease V-like protein UPF0215 family